jgi:hypothetical protein
MLDFQPDVRSFASFLTSARLPKQDKFTKFSDRDRPDLVIPRLYIQKKARIYPIVHDFDLLTHHCKKSIGLNLAGAPRQPLDSNIVSASASFSNTLKIAIVLSAIAIGS